MNVQSQLIFGRFLYDMFKYNLTEKAWLYQATQ